MSIIKKQAACLNCGAPLPGPTCLYCGSIFKTKPDHDHRHPNPKEHPDLLPKGLFEVTVGGTRYRVLGQLAQGENSDVFLARRARAATEQVVIKLAKHSASLEREWDTLRHLDGRDSFLDCLLPRPVDSGEVQGRRAFAYRWRSGFVYTLKQARAEYPEGIEAEATVWMWNRILDQLACLNELGYGHGDLRLEHLLVHPRDHGIAFCGWGKARLGESEDLAASGRCINELLGAKAPLPLLELARKARQFQSPLQLQSELKDVSQMLFGAPRFHKFVLPRKPSRR